MYVLLQCAVVIREQPLVKSILTSGRTLEGARQYLIEIYGKIEVYCELQTTVRSSKGQVFETAVAAQGS